MSAFGVHYSEFVSVITSDAQQTRSPREKVGLGGRQVQKRSGPRYGPHRRAVQHVLLGSVTRTVEGREAEGRAEGPGRGQLGCWYLPWADSLSEEQLQYGYAPPEPP